jgi:hypothetical protein
VEHTLRVLENRAVSKKGRVATATVVIAVVPLTTPPSLHQTLFLFPLLHFDTYDTLYYVYYIILHIMLHAVPNPSSRSPTVHVVSAIPTELPAAHNADSNADLAACGVCCVSRLSDVKSVGLFGHNSLLKF